MLNSFKFDSLKKKMHDMNGRSPARSINIIIIIIHFL